MLIHFTVQCIFVGHIYAVVALKDNEWGTDYWLARCIEGKQTIITSLTDSEGIKFPIGSMVVKGEYLTPDGKSRKTSGYVFMDYRQGSVVYHFTNLVIGTNIQLTTNVEKELQQGTLLPTSFRIREIDGDH